MAGPHWSAWEMDVHNTLHPVLAFNTSSGMQIDASQYDFPNEKWLRRPAWEIAVKVAAFLPFVAVGMLANAALIAAVCLRRRLRAAPTHVILANLAAADLVTLVIGPAMFICTDVFQGYVMGEGGCRTEGFLNCALLITAVMNVAAVGYDRLATVVLATHEHARLGRRGTRVVVLGSWLVGVVVSAPLVVYRVYKERQWRDYLEQYCAEDVTVLVTYWYVVTVLAVWLPLGVIGVCYGAIFFKLERYEQRTSKTRRSMRVARAMFMVLVVFACCRLPYTALIMRRARLLRGSSRNQVDDDFRSLWFAARYLIFINAAINPVMYGLASDHLRRAMWSLLGAAGGGRGQGAGPPPRHCRPPTPSTECHL